MYSVSAMLSANDGELNVLGADLGAARHWPPASVVGTFHRTAESMGNIVAKHAHSAVEGAIMAARNDIRAGIPVKVLDVSRVKEEEGLLTGRDIVEELHGDGSHAVQLASVAVAAGLPLTFTVLPGNGCVFNTRAIPSSSKNHRQNNNRLKPMTKVDGR